MKRTTSIQTTIGWVVYIALVALIISLSSCTKTISEPRITGISSSSTTADADGIVNNH